MPERVSVTRRTDGRFVTTVQVNGTRRFVYGRGEAEVRRKVKELRHQAVTAGTLPTPGRRTINTLLDAWLDAVSPRLKPNSIAIYRGLADQHIRPAVGRVQLARLEPSSIQALYTRLRGLGHVQTPSLVHTVLFSACSFAVRWDWLASNPCAKVVAPRYTAPRHEVWSAGEARQLLAAVRTERDGPLFTFLMLSGARIGEATALTWDDVQGTTVEIRRTMQYLHKEWVTTSAKTRASERRVTLSPSAISALSDERARQAERGVSAGVRWAE